MVAALSGVLAVSGLAWWFWSHPAVQPVDAGPPVEEPDAGALRFQRPTTFRAREIVFTIDPPWAGLTIPTQLALVLLSATALFALGWFIRRSTWLPRVLAPPRVPGPAEVPPLRIVEGPRSPGLLAPEERDELAFAVDRFVREEPSPEVDVRRSIDATIDAGGRAEVVFRPRIEHRTVWLWTDAASSSALVPRFAREIAASLASAGLPSERGRFACVPDRVDSDERGALEPHELEDAAMGSAVLLVTDGEGLARRLGDSASRGWVRPLLRVLSRWPRVAFIAVADEGRRALSAAFGRFDVGVSVLAPDEVGGFLAGQEPRRAPRERPRMVGDTLAWAAACCLSGRTVDAPAALALRAAMGLEAPVWDVELVLGEARAGGEKRRADRLRWLAHVSGAGKGGVAVPEGSLLDRALAFFRQRLWEENEERTRRDAEDPWTDTPAQRRLRRQCAMLDLWRVPDEALAELHRLYPTDDATRSKVLAGYAAGATGVLVRAPEGVVGLPWAMRDLADASCLLAQDLGLRVIGEVRWSRVVPGRAMLAVGVVLGLSAGAGAGAVGRWVKLSTWAPRCVPPEGGWCEVDARANGRYTVLAGSGREVGKAENLRGGAVVKATWGAEMRMQCEEWVDAVTTIRRCGQKEIPQPRPKRVTHGEPPPPPGWQWDMRRSRGYVVGEKDDPERDAWADALIDSGSADEVVVSSEPDLRLLDQATKTMPLQSGDQVLIVGLKGLPSTISFLSGVDVAEVSPQGSERHALTGTEVRTVAETWSNAKILYGDPQLAGVAVADVDADAPAPTDPVGPIHNSSECPPREVEDNGLVFVRVCGGDFWMGSKSDPDAAADETPYHSVQVSTFWIGKYEVSNEQYRVQQHGHGPGEKATWPVTNVNWAEAQTFCDSLGHRLPTETEWEYAARGPEGRKYPWGDQVPTQDLAVFARDLRQGPEDVTSLGNVGSPFGTAHQAGNVFEWVQDWYGLYNDGTERGALDPLGPSSGSDRVLRGGSFWNVARDVRSAFRLRLVPGHRGPRFGFRCARGRARQP